MISAPSLFVADDTIELPSLFPRAVESAANESQRKTRAMTKKEEEMNAAMVELSLDEIGWHALAVHFEYKKHDTMESRKDVSQRPTMFVHMIYIVF